MAQPGNLADEVRNNTFEMVVSNLVTRKTQMNLKKLLYKIYPVNEAAIRILQFAKENAVEMQVEEVKAESTEEAVAEEMDESSEEDEALPEAA